MSSPNHLTSNIEDAFSEYISVVPDYSPASQGKTYSSASNNSTDLIPPTSSNFLLFHNDPYINVKNAYATFTPSPIPNPPPTIKSTELFLSKELLSPKKQKQDQYFQDYRMGESLHDSTLEQHEKQIEEILNHLDELPLDRIKRIEDDVEALGKVQRQVINTKTFPMPPKRSSTSEASTMTQDAIRKLVVDSIAVALETQTATMAEADNSIRQIPVAKRGTIKNSSAVNHSTSMVRKELLDSSAGSRELNQYFLEATVLKRIKLHLLSIEDEFYNLSVKCNDLKTYVRKFQELAVLCPNMVPNNEKLVEVFIGGLPRSIEGNVTASKPQTLEEAINIA
nr:reverse transcriptase domain-containing protein [Tanacetum cinerariifolium]